MAEDAFKEYCVHVRETVYHGYVVAAEEEDEARDFYEDGYLDWSDVDGSEIVKVHLYGTPPCN